MSKEAAEFIANKKLVLKDPMVGYIIPYAYLLTLLNDFSDSRPRKSPSKMERPVFSFDNQMTFDGDRNKYIEKLEAYCDSLEEELEEANDEIRVLGEDLDWIYSQGDDEDYY